MDVDMGPADGEQPSRAVRLEKHVQDAETVYSVVLPNFLANDAAEWSTKLRACDDCHFFPHLIRFFQNCT